MADQEAAPEGPTEHRGIAVAPMPVAATVVMSSDGGSASCASIVAQMVERACDVHLTDAGEPPPPVPGKPSPVLITLMIGPPGAADGGLEMTATPYFSDDAKCVAQAQRGFWNLPSPCRHDLTLHFLHE
jgi:hypothetical protein